MGGLGAILAWAWGEQSNERAELGYGHFVTADYLSLLHMLTNSGKAVNVNSYPEQPTRITALHVPIYLGLVTGTFYIPPLFISLPPTITKD